MKKRGRKTPAPKNAIYGIIERDGEGRFFACTHGVKEGAVISATGRTDDEAKWLLEQKIKRVLKRKRVSLILTPMTPLKDHRCSVLRSVEN